MGKYSQPLNHWDYWPWYGDNMSMAVITDFGPAAHEAIVGRNSHDPWRVLDDEQPYNWWGAAIPAPHFYAVNLIGAEAPARMASMPKQDGLTARLDLDGDQRLHAAICVDGRCYQTSIDLRPAIALVMEQMAAWHAAQHDGSQPAPHLTKVSGDVMLGCVDRAVSAAGDALIGALIDRHVSVCGIFDDIGNALKGIGSGVSHAVTGTVKALKGPITIAATAAATAYGGPAGGALASQLVGPVLDQVAGKDAPQVAAAEQAAKTDPRVAHALANAKSAVAHTVAAYHVRETAKAAAAGHPAAQQQISNVVQTAQAGDPVAQSATDVIAHAIADRAQHSQWGAQLWEQITGRGPATVSSGWVDMVGVTPWVALVGATTDVVRKQAQAAVARTHGRVVGVLVDASGQWQLESFSSVDAADDWFARATHDPTSFTYAAYYDKSDPLFPHPLNEAIGGVHAASAPGPLIHRGVAEI